MATSLRVLVGADGSELADHAAERAAAIIRQPATFLFVEVVRPVPVTVPPVPDLAVGTAVGAVEVAQLEEVNEQRAREAHERLDGLCTRLKLAAAERRVLMGEPGPALCELAETEGMDLVVVGSHGSGLLRRLVLGSVSDYVVRHAPCPVFVAHAAPSEDSKQSDR